eukprot:m.70028 g.70028  ORF g.70028 m.70028 type:complete len:256 (+) comp14284_c0_seq1:242-1009(+)
MAASDRSLDKSCLTGPAAVRVRKELASFQSLGHPLMCFEGLAEDRLDRWLVVLRGPPDSPYQGGRFRVLVRFPETYPMDPPSVQFLEEFFHPNVYRDGKVCLSTLQQPVPKHIQSAEDVKAAQGAANWSPALDVESIFISVVSLLADPNPNDPANLDAATMFTKNHAAFVERVREIAALSQVLCPDEGISEHPVKRSAGCSGCTCPQCGEPCDRKNPCMFFCIHDDEGDSEAESFGFDDDDEEEEEEGAEGADDE